MEISEQQRRDITESLGSGSVNLFGRPFAGKDSQGAILVELFGGNLIGGGDILRSSVIPERVSAYIRAGELIPSEDYVDIVLPFLSQDHLADQPLFLSSVGRWHGEEEGVIRALDRAAHPLQSVVYIHLSEEAVRQRWEQHEATKDRGERHDDSREILETRFKEFAEKTLPVIEFYRERNMLIEVEGDQPREDVTRDILAQLALRASTN